MIEILESYDVGYKKIIKFDNTIIDIIGDKGSRLEYIPDLKLKELIHLLKLYEIRSVSIVE